MRLASPGRLPIADLDKQIASSISSGTRYPTVRRGPPRITHFHIHTSSDTWRLDVPMAGIDPNDVVIEVAGRVAKRLDVELKKSVYVGRIELAA